MAVASMEALPGARRRAEGQTALAAWVASLRIRQRNAASAERADILEVLGLLVPLATEQPVQLLSEGVLRDHGDRLRRFGERVQQFIDAHAQDEMRVFVQPLAQLGERLVAVTLEATARVLEDPRELPDTAVGFLRVFRDFVFGFLFASEARVALSAQAIDPLACGERLGELRCYLEELAARLR